MSPAAAEDVIRFLEENPGFFIEHPEFLRASGAGVALVSAGKRNRYRHPTPETLARLKLMG